MTGSPHNFASSARPPDKDKTHGRTAQADKRSSPIFAVRRDDEDQVEEMRAENDTRTLICGGGIRIRTALAEQAQTGSGTLKPEPEHQEFFNFPTNDKPGKNAPRPQRHGESVYRNARRLARMATRLIRKPRRSPDGDFKRTPEKAVRGRSRRVSDRTGNPPFHLNSALGGATCSTDKPVRWKSQKVLKPENNQRRCAAGATRSWAAL